MGVLARSPDQPLLQPAVSSRLRARREGAALQDLHMVSYEASSLLQEDISGFSRPEHSRLSPPGTGGPSSLHPHMGRTTEMLARDPVVPLSPTHSGTPLEVSRVACDSCREGSLLWGLVGKGTKEEHPRRINRVLPCPRLTQSVVSLPVPLLSKPLGP